MHNKRREKGTRVWGEFSTNFPRVCVTSIGAEKLNVMAAGAPAPHSPAVLLPDFRCHGLAVPAFALDKNGITQRVLFARGSVTLISPKAAQMEAGSSVTGVVIASSGGPRDAVGR